MQVYDGLAFGLLREPTRYINTLACDVLCLHVHTGLSCYSINLYRATCAPHTLNFDGCLFTLANKMDCIVIGANNVCRGKRLDGFRHNCVGLQEKYHFFYVDQLFFNVYIAFVELPTNFIEKLLNVAMFQI